MDAESIRRCSDDQSKFTEQADTLPQLAQGGSGNAIHSQQAEESAATVHRYRSQSFHWDYRPFEGHADLRIRGDQVTGPVWFMSPTRAIFSYTATTPDIHLETTGVQLTELRQPQAAGQSSVAENSNVEFKWTSRDNRKGRHALIVRESSERANPYQAPPSTKNARSVLRGIWRMATVGTLHDVSYLLAVTFSAACTILLLTAILSFLPSIRPSFKSSETLYRAESILGALGCTIFAAGSLISFSEAVNVNRRGCFGWKLVQIEASRSTARSTSAGPEIEKSMITVLVPDGSCSHHHDSYKIVKGHPQDWSEAVAARRADSIRPQDRTARTKQHWIWLPSWSEVRHHLIYDFGFVCATTLTCSSLLYCVMAWTAVGYLFLKGEIADWIRIPQIIAASGFIVSCLVAMIETQRNWWLPSPRVLGWQANLFNVIGSVGFLLAAVSGYMQRKWWWAPFHLSCAYFWGSLTFLVGSLIQWYEALDKYPVEHVKEKKKKR